MTDRRSTRGADETRARILDAARSAFSRNGYEQVGVREIARAVGVDAALVNRYFGSKAGLFDEVTSGAFAIGRLFDGPLAGLGARLADFVLSRPADGGFDPLQLLLRSAVSPAASSVVAARFAAELIAPLARRLGGRKAAVRATLIAAYVIGLATVRVALAAPAARRHGSDAARLFARAVNAAVKDGR